MLFRKQGFPEEGDLVLCTVTSVQFHSVFVDIDEYGKGGMIHISEIAPGRIRNIRDFVIEGEKIIEIAAGKVGLKTEQLYSEVSGKIKNYASLYECFEAASKDDKLLESLGIDKKYTNVLEEIIKQRIKPSEVEIVGKLKITVFAPNGIDIVKDSLKKAEEAAKERISIKYLGSGLYRFMVKAPDYKEAEKLMKNATESAINYVTKHAGTAEFARESA